MYKYRILLNDMQRVTLGDWETVLWQQPFTFSLHGNRYLI